MKITVLAIAMLLSGCSAEQLAAAADGFARGYNPQPAQASSTVHCTTTSDGHTINGSATTICR